MSTIFRLFRLTSLAIAAFFLLPIPAANADLIAVQVSDMYVFGSDPLEPVKGVATLTREDDGVEILISTSGLDSMGAYSVWWVVFNNPAGCIDGCDGSDLSNPAADGSLLWGAGFLSDMDGFITVSAELGVGEPPGEVWTGNPDGLTNLIGSEIHVVLRLHTNAGTPVAEGQLAEWVSSFNGGCPDGDGCSNQQFTIFAAVPIPAAVWLFGSALGLLGWVRRRHTA